MFRYNPIVGFTYVSLREAIEMPGLRMVVVGGIPSPWGEAAKGILHVKGIEWTAVRLDRDEALKQWSGARSGPIAIYNDERPRPGWPQILLLAERLAPTPPLLPTDAGDRALAMGLSHEICGEAGLSWSRRLQAIHGGLTGGAGFPPQVAAYLAKKYGYTPQAGAAAADRVAALLAMLTARLRQQRNRGSRYYIGQSLTAVDIYSATAVALFSPLPHERCAMDPSTRAVFELRDPQTQAALDPIVVEHRDMMYAEHLELPLSL